MAQTAVRRWAWIGTFVVGAALYLLVLAVLTDTDNPNLFPTMILLGALVVPLTFVTFASGGNVGAAEQTLFIRGLLSPAGHAAWTGLTCWGL
jgi:hypothetical protein